MLDLHRDRWQGVRIVGALCVCMCALFFFLYLLRPLHYLWLFEHDEHQALM